MTRHTEKRLRSFSEQEIQRAITDTVGTSPSYTPSKRIMRNVGIQLARTFSPRLPLNTLLEKVVQEATTAKPLTADIAKVYVSVAVRLLANRQRSQARSAAGRDRGVLRPQVTSQPSTMG